MAVKVVDLRAKSQDGGDAEKKQKSGSALHLALREHVKEEETVWRELGTHPNCVRLLEVAWEQSFAFFVMERCSSTMLSALQSLPDLNERHLSVLILDMFKGLGHCHSLDVVHRDLKPDNFLVFGDGAVKLCDFGLATFCLPGTTLLGTYGTAPFMSPEMLNKMPYDTKTDMWSMGVVLYVLLFGDFPYAPKVHTSTEVKIAIRSGQPLPRFAATQENIAESGGTISTEADALARGLLNRNSDERLSVKDGLQSHWLRSAGAVRAAPEASLQPMLRDAIQKGAFERKDLTVDRDGVDSLLADLQAPFSPKPPSPRNGAKYYSSVACLDRLDTPYLMPQLDASYSTASRSTSPRSPKKKVSFVESSVSTRTGGSTSLRTSGIRPSAILAAFETPTPVDFGNGNVASV